MECHLIHDDSCCLSSLVSKEMIEASDSATVNDTVLNAPTMAWHPILCTFSNWFKTDIDVFGAQITEAESVTGVTVLL